MLQCVMSLRSLLILIFAPIYVQALEVIIMDYSDCQDETITVYNYTQKEKEPLESGDNVYYSDGYDEPDPNQYYTPAPADYYIPYIFRPY